MEASHKITYDGAITSNTVAVSLPSSDGNLTVTATTCDCGFFKSMTLPCRHILFFRRQSLLNEYSPDLSAYRWTKAYFRKSHVVFDESQQPENNIQLTTTPRCRRVRVLSGQDKYRRVHGTTQQLARLVSDMPMRQFNEHVQNLEQIVDLLKDGKEYNVQDVQQDDILAALNPIVEIGQDNEDGDDNRGSLQMDDVAFSTSEAVHDNAEPHIPALELATRIQDQFSRASTSSTATNGNTSQDDESHHDSTHDNGITSSDDFPLLTEPSYKLPPKMIRRGRPKGAETTVVGLLRRTKRVMPFLKRRPKEKEEALNPIVEIGQDNEDGDDNRGSLQMDDVAFSTSEAVHDNAEPHTSIRTSYTHTRPVQQS
ncbi:ZSWIM3 [Mytilus coruscus]|uniref:ZSWIM3 n=1 Tax=Mytilus coruscus TaxID=42192 RepID=A0A6J8BIE7_MYTCO|nr:ZSWIM3 [Mytilus coruscus]